MALYPVNDGFILQQLGWAEVFLPVEEMGGPFNGLYMDLFPLDRPRNIPGRNLVCVMDVPDIYSGYVYFERFPQWHLVHAFYYDYQVGHLVGKLTGRFYRAYFDEGEVHFRPVREAKLRAEGNLRESDDEDTEDEVDR